MPQKSNTRIGLVAVIAILAIVLSIVLFNLAQAVRVANQKPRLIWQAGNSGKSVPMEVGFRTASNRAYQWAKDVVLIRVESNWHPQDNWKSIEYPPVIWSYVFYSPSEKATATVSIDGDEVYWVDPRVITSRPADIEPNSFPPASGVNVVWFSLLAAGGEEFLESYSNVLVHFVLQPDKTDPSSTNWQAFALTRDDNGHYMEVTLEAQTGILIDSIPSQ